MKKNISRALILFTAVLGIFVVPDFSKAISSKECISKLESYIKKTSTKAVLYGKYKKKLSSLPLSKSSLTISKKGKYIFSIISKKGKVKTLTATFQKGIYPISINTAKKKTAGEYYIYSCEDVSKALFNDREPSVRKKNNTAACIWALEPVSGNKFRLKNLNSNTYLSADSKISIKPYSLEDKSLIFKNIKIRGKSDYIKAVDKNKYLYVKDGLLTLGKYKSSSDYRFKFEKKKATTSAINIASYTYPKSIEKKSAFTIKGAISSVFSLKSVTVRVINSNKKDSIKKSANCTGYTYNISKIDPDVKFGTLDVGKYTYEVSATDIKGKTIILLSKPFSVTEPKSTSTTLVDLSTTARILSYDSKLISAIGHQSTGDSYEKKACASFALAYCNAILNKTTPKPQSYWTSSTDVSCNWDRGGYKTISFGAYSNPPQELLKTAYNYLLKGQPTILQATGNTDQHWLTIVGYQNVKDVSNLTTSNFIAIDPWDGNVIVVSNKYRIRTSYRLAVPK